MLDVGQGNFVYWETCGNPDGKPALVVHGGPGSACSAGVRRSFAPDRYRAVLFDQRGCGRSTPHAGDPAIDMSVNTTEHLLADMELLRGTPRHRPLAALRRFVGVHAEPRLRTAPPAPGVGDRHPQRHPTRRSEIYWLYRGAARFFPAEWDQFRAGVPEADRDGDLVAAYARLMPVAWPASRAC